MRKQNFLFIGAIGFLILAGCGKDKPGNPEAYQAGSNKCSSQFVSDFNKVMTNALFVSKKEDIAKVRSLAEQFKAKYNGVQCEAELIQPGKLDRENTTVNATAKMDELIAALDKASGAVNPKPAISDSGKLTATPPVSDSVEDPKIREMREQQ